jgi:ssDNA-binding Zn-finger/Zn-ribbon topoisomerase 1
MARRGRNQHADGVEVIVKLALLVIMMIALAAGGLGGVAKAFSSLIGIVVTLAIVGVTFLVLLVVGKLIYRRWWIPRSENIAHPTAWALPSREAGARPIPVCEPVHVWTPASVLIALGEIDWFQFERFCGALLRTEGYEVTRKGGAQPDGGVDLIAEKGDERILVQCKQWRTWTVQEKVVREMLGSMTHFEVSRGAIYTLKGWTRPAAGFALGHSITLVDGEELARRAVARLSTAKLDEVLDTTAHHCPKCYAPMVFREGNFRSFWGCSTYPRCRFTLKHTGAR